MLGRKKEDVLSQKQKLLSWPKCSGERGSGSKGTQTSSPKPVPLKHATACKTATPLLVLRSGSKEYTEKKALKTHQSANLTKGDSGKGTTMEWRQRAGSG